MHTIFTSQSCFWQMRQKLFSYVTRKTVNKIFCRRRAGIQPRVSYALVSLYFTLYKDTDISVYQRVVLMLSFYFVAGPTLVPGAV